MHFSHRLREGARPEVARDNLGHAHIDVTQISYGKSRWKQRVDAVTQAVEAVTPSFNSTYLACSFGGDAGVGQCRAHRAESAELMAVRQGACDHRLIRPARDLMPLGLSVHSSTPTEADICGSSVCIGACKLGASRVGVTCLIDRFPGVT
jgi:hypothetical protein